MLLCIYVSVKERKKEQEREKPKRKHPQAYCQTSKTFKNIPGGGMSKRQLLMNNFLNLLCCLPYILFLPQWEKERKGAWRIMEKTGGSGVEERS